MKLINVILKIYERWQDRRRFGKLEPLDHYCVRRVLENGDEIKYMMRYDPQTTKRVQQSTTSLTDVHEREEQCRPLHATRIIGQEVWKAEVLLVATGAAIGYTQRGQRVDLGLAMGCVKQDISEIKGMWESGAERGRVDDLRICRLFRRV